MTEAMGRARHLETSSSLSPLVPHPNDLVRQRIAVVRVEDMLSAEMAMLAESVANGMVIVTFRPLPPLGTVSWTSSTLAPRQIERCTWMLRRLMSWSVHFSDMISPRGRPALPPRRTSRWMRGSLFAAGSTSRL